MRWHLRLLVQICHARWLGDPRGGTGCQEPGQALPSSCSIFKTGCALTMRLSAKTGSWVLQTRCLKTAKLSPPSSAETLPSRIIGSRDFK